MNKEEFVNKLKDPLNAEALELDEVVTSMAEGNKVETIPGYDLMYITVFMDRTSLCENTMKDIERRVDETIKHWHLEAIHYTPNAEISMGFRAK